MDNTYDGIIKELDLIIELMNCRDNDQLRTVNKLLETKLDNIKPYLIKKNDECILVIDHLIELINNLEEVNDTTKIICQLFSEIIKNKITQTENLKLQLTKIKKEKMLNNK